MLLSGDKFAHPGGLDGALSWASTMAYWLMRLPLWSKHNIFLEVTAA
ncbi:MAG TPA: hypothetical protein VJ756_08775 [Terriglobales bacterium]|nr:hypothetical protein [Terriglobales bacterium]